MAGYDRWTGRDEAEVAFITDDEHHGRGLATVLLEWLVVAAREVGFRGADRPGAADQPQHARRLPPGRASRPPARSTDGVVEVRLGLEPTPRRSAAVEERARRAEARSVERLISPTSVAVIGAGRERGGLGHEVFRNLLAHDFMGPVYPVNPLGRSRGQRAELPDRARHPRRRRPGGHRRAGPRGAGRRRPVRPQAGAGAGGHERRASTAPGRWARRPSAPWSSGPAARACASSVPSRWASSTPTPTSRCTPSSRRSTCCRAGSASSPSRARSASPPSSTPAGSGSASRRSSTWGPRPTSAATTCCSTGRSDERTDVVLLYLESFGNPRKFTRIARRLSRRKPIVAVKAAEGPAGRPAAARRSTGRPRLAGRRHHRGAARPQSGVIRVDTPDRAVRRGPGASSTSRCPPVGGSPSSATRTARAT